MKFVLGIDPGVAGAFVLTDGGGLNAWPMPVETFGKKKEVHFDGVREVLAGVVQDHGRVHVFLERAVPMAMGSAGAFSYGRGFQSIVIALKLYDMPVTLIEPSKWTREMHEGILNDLKPKVRSEIAVKRLYPTLVGLLPTRPKGGLHDGMVDALLIAGYGLRRLSGGKRETRDDSDVGDFL